MASFSLTHLADRRVTAGLRERVAHEREATAWVLAHVAEADARRLYAAEGFPSMFEYCVRGLGYSEDAAARRIHAAPTARRFPAIHAATEAGRLHLTAVNLLAPHLAPANAAQLLAQAAGKSRAQVEQMLAERFPRPDIPASSRALAATPQFQRAPAHADAAALLATSQPAPEHVDAAAVQAGPEHAPAHADASGLLATSQHAPAHVGAGAGSGVVAADATTPARATIAPLAARRFALQVTIGETTLDKLRHAQELLGHAVATTDLANVVDQALDALIVTLERRRFAATGKPRPRRSHASGRYIPADVRRAVWHRDQGRCTFVSDDGQPCGARARLEYDHIKPVARGGRTRAENLRLRCRAHNQHAAELAYGRGFMEGKRRRGKSGTIAGPQIRRHSNAGRGEAAQ